uniref:Uncharacterized protein n=1 Tax=Anguilla anguilla TaxID=7936 RepID=A0A0E9WPH9_ANGAN
MYLFRIYFCMLVNFYGFTFERVAGNLSVFITGLCSDCKSCFMSPVATLVFSIYIFLIEIQSAKCRRHISWKAFLDQMCVCWCDEALCFLQTGIIRSFDRSPYPTKNICVCTLNPGISFPETFFCVFFI